MKLVRGKTLGRALDECDSLGDRLKLLGHFEDMCQAIAYAHSRGVIHRDIKPDNVMLGEFGETVVLDWGLAKMRGRKDAHGDKLAREVQVFQRAGHGQTMHGQAIGTPSYMSPEMAEGAIDRIDERSDVWCLGTVLYRILTGRPPFISGDPLRTIEMVKSEPVTPVRKLCPEAPADLAAVVEKALQRDPPGGIRRRARSLRRSRRFKPAPASKPTNTRPMNCSVGSLPRQGAQRAGAALVIFLFASSGMIWSAYQRARHAKTVAENARIVAEHARGDAMASRPRRKKNG
jgi:serine/threonine-protein kinase